MPLYVVPQHEPWAVFFAVLAAILRAGWRYRSELAPLTTAVAVAGAGWRLHHFHPGAWPVLIGLTVAMVAGVVWAPRRWPRLRRAPMLGKPTERLWLSLWLAVGGGWLAAADAVGPRHPPLGAVWVWATLICALPWWADHRRRAKVTLDRTITRWPELTDSVVALAGSTVLSAARTAWGWTARVALRRGQTVRAAIDQVASIESALGARPGAVRIEPDPTDARHLVMRVIESDPHAQPIGWPGLTAPSTQPSIRQPADIGVFEDGQPVTVLLTRRHVLIGGATGSGKSGLLNVIMAVLTGCRDAVVWGIDLKQGMELRPWAPCLHRSAFTPQHAAAALHDAVAELERRANLLAQLGSRVWEPTPDAPALVIAIDEYAELAEEAKAWADSLARRGRAVAVTLLVATQRPTQSAMGNGAVRSQMDVRVCLRVRERRDTDLILGQGMHNAGWRAEELRQEGKLLISAPEHTSPRPARAYLITDTDVAAVARRHAAHRPPSAGLPGPVIPAPRDNGENTTTGNRRTPRKPRRSDDEMLWQVLIGAPEDGTPIADIRAATKVPKTTLYRRLHALAAQGRAVQPSPGRWRSHPR